MGVPGYPKIDCFIMENPVKLDDLGVPLFLETTSSFSHRRIFPMCNISNLPFWQSEGTSTNLKSELSH